MTPEIKDRVSPDCKLETYQVFFSSSSQTEQIFSSRAEALGLKNNL